MQIIINLSLILNFFGATQAVMLAVILFLNRTRNQGNLILSALLVVFAVIIGNTILILTDLSNQFVFYQDMTNAVTLLIGPLIFMLVKYFISHEKRQPPDVWHLLPFALYLPLAVGFELANGHGKYDIRFLEVAQMVIMPWVWNVQMIIYLWLSFALIKQRDRNANHDIQWIRKLVLGIALICLLNFMLAIISKFIFPISDIILLNITLLLAFITIAIAYKSFRGPISQSGKSIQTGFTPEQTAVYLKKLNELIEKEKAYKDQHLRVSGLANKMGISSRQLAQLLKTAFAQNFNEFINSHRANEVIQRLAANDNKHYTIMGLASEAGFKSNSAFYKAFKLKTGVTPVAYLETRSAQHPS